MMPETIAIDHEQIFMSDHVDSVCRRLGISVQPARLDTARDKGPLERFFLTLRHDLLQFLPGYKGNDLTARGVAPEADAVFLIDQLEDLIREWVAAVYHCTTHDGLCEPGLDTLELSPAAMFERGVALAGYIEVPRDPDLAFEFLQVVSRTTHPPGSHGTTGSTTTASTTCYVSTPADTARMAALATKNGPSPSTPMTSPKSTSDTRKHASGIRSHGSTPPS